MNLGIVAQRGNDRAVSLATELTDALEGVSVTLDEATASAVDATGVPVGEMVGYPLVVSIGGDGTFLYVARHVGSTPILGVNLGEVGFLNAVTPDEAVERVRDEVERVRRTGSVRFREAHRVVAEGDGWSVGPGLNEVVVQGALRGRGQGLETEVRLDGSTYARGHADGVLVATPTGSTAYNLSEGGPLVHPLVDGLVVTQMCAVNGMPPIVVGLDRELAVRVSGVDEAVVVADGSERRWIDAPATVRVRPAEDPARIVGPRSDFSRALDKIDSNHG